MGTLFASYFFDHDNLLAEQPDGPEVNFVRFPLHTGLTYRRDKHLVELSLTYNYNNDLSYYLSRSTVAAVEMPSLFAAVSYRFTFDTTVGAEVGWESGRTHQVTEKLAAIGRLDGLFLGIGLSSSFGLKNQPFNIGDRAHLSSYGLALFPDMTVGYYHHGLDLSLAANYRSYTSGASSYGYDQELSRRSFGLELIKYIGDYHGFVPFIGPILAYDQFGFRESIHNVASPELGANDLAIGITFGWDIRPDRIQRFLLRTNLRYFPTLQMPIGNGIQINANNLEFNFIQLVVYPGRW